jgi:hypothetical protein
VERLTTSRGEGTEEEPPPEPLGVLVPIGIVTSVLAAVVVLGPAALAAWAFWRSGMTTFAVVCGAIAAVWLALLVSAAARSRETRGWVAFGLFGWLAVIPMLVRALIRRTRALR